MNLGKLLGAGKSIFGGGEPAAYRQNKHVYLPKFNAENNPFSPKMPEPAPLAAAPVVIQKSAPAAARPTRATNWTTKLNPFRAPVPERQVGPNAVQTELTLDAVKVVHNDLDAADIEVVPIKSRTVAAPETSAVSAARGAWEFAGDRLGKPV